MNISHVALWTIDLQVSSAFWRRYFDAEVGPVYRSKRRAGFVSCFVTLPGANAKIELMTGPWVSNVKGPENTGWDHIAISLGNHEAVNALAARCEADGLLVSSPRTTGDGFYEAVVAAPDGTLIEITA
jgi:lactoylglutathione lyase